MNKINNILNKPKARVYIYLAIIIGVTLVVYYPSFVHLLRGETYSYLMQTMGDNSAVSLIKNNYNYEMIRVFDTGDSLVLRPLLFVLMGIEKALFGINYTCWRIAAFLFHLIATLCLFRLLWKIRPTIIAMFATILFSTTFIAMNTVLYEHLSSYLLFIALILTTFYYVYCGVESGKTKHLIFASVSMLFACFFLEFGIVLTVLLIGYLWFERKRPNFNWRRWAIVFMVILLIFSASYTIETLLNPTPTTNSDLNAILSTENIQSISSNGQDLFMLWSTQSIFPAKFTAEISTNLRANSIQVLQTFSLVPFIFNSIVVIILVASVFIKTRRDKKRIGGLFLALLMLVPFILVMSNAFFRGRTHGDDYLLNDCNHTVYLWTGLSILAVYAFFSLKRLTIRHTGLISLALIILISLNAPLTFRLNQEIREHEEPFRVYLQEIDNFLEVHRKDYRPEDEPDFSFNSIINSPKLEKGLGIILWKGLPNQPDYTRYNFTVPEVLYWNYWSNDNPKYSLIYHLEEEWLEVILNE